MIKRLFKSHPIHLNKMGTIILMPAMNVIYGMVVQNPEIQIVLKLLHFWGPLGSRLASNQNILQGTVYNVPRICECPPSFKLHILGPPPKTQNSSPYFLFLVLEFQKGMSHP